MENPKKFRLIMVAAIVAFISIIGIASVEYTSQVGFCNSCHEMNEAFSGWETGVHGTEHCYGCHTDDGIIAKAKVKANGLREVYIHFTEKVNMDAVQAEVADSRCKKCHQFTKDQDNKTVSEKRIAAFHLQHKGYNFNCVTCHVSVGHSNNAFVGFKNEACRKCHVS